MKKILSALFLALCLGLGVVGQPSIDAATTVRVSPYELNVNGTFIPLDVQPLVSNSSLLIPIRSLSSLGLSYGWDASSKTVTITNTAGDVLTVTLNSKTDASKNGVSIEMTVPAQSTGGCVFVPLRFISESLGYQVQYESIRKMIFVNSSDYNFDPSVFEQSDLVAARKAAISLPLTADFKTLGFGARSYHSYRFPVGKADTYVFGDSYTKSIVKIENGKAIVVGQFVEGGRSDFAHKAGNLTGTNTADPALVPFLFGVTFYHDPNTTTTGVSYWEVDPATDHNSMKSFTKSYGVYSDIIQQVSNDI